MIDWLEQPSLPSDWRETTIGEAYVFTRRPRTFRVMDYPTVPFVPMEMVPSQGKARIRWLDKSPDELTSGNYFERGDVLLSRITPSFENGKQGMADDLPLPFGFGSTELIPIQAKPGESDAHFLFYLLLHPSLRAEVAARMEGSTGRQRVPESVVREWPIPLPQLDEQRKVAAVLGKVQAAVEVEGELIRVTRELKQAALRQLFTRGLRGEPQKQTDLGPIPESWDVVPLGILATKISKGSSPKWQGFQYVSEGVLFVRSQNVGLGAMDWSDKAYLPAAWNEKEPRSILRENDVLLNLVGASIGRASLGGQEVEGANCNQAVCFVRVKSDEALPSFVAQFLNSPAGLAQMHFQKKDVARANLSLDDVRSFKTPKPGITEQREIAAHLAAIDAKLAHHETRQKLLRELFRTLLRDLMTARRRVTSLDLADLSP